MKWNLPLRGLGKNGGAKKKPVPPAALGTAVLFPGPEAWELWSGPVGQSVCSGTADQPGKLRPGSGTVMSLPSRTFFSMPLWVPVVEESPAREQAQIQLEMKGLLGANPEAAVWNCETIRREPLPPTPEGETPFRQLEATAVLAASFPEGWLVEQATRFEPAGRMLLPVSGGSLGVLRRELGRWVADFYREGKWLHTQPLLAPTLEASAAVELVATKAQLEGEGILIGLDNWWVREPGAAPGEEFRRILGGTIRVEERVSPCIPAEGWNLPPPALTELRAERSRQAHHRKLIRTAMAGYLALVLLAGGVFAWPVVRLKLVERELATLGEEAARIRSTALLWREAGAWLDSRRNALEILWQVSRPLIETDPAKIEGVRLTVFDLNPKRLVLQGEGKDLEVVEKYLQWLKAEPALVGWTWKNPQPRLLPNGNAQFQAEGTPPGVSPEEGKGGEGENADAP